MTTWHVRHGPESRLIGNSSLLAGLCSRLTRPTSAGPGVAIREFILEKGHGRVDYLLFVSGQPAGVIEANTATALRRVVRG
jgi:hypothetical protein